MEPGGGVCPGAKVGIGATPVTIGMGMEGTCTKLGVGREPGTGVGKGHCGTLQHPGSWGSGTRVQAAGGRGYVGHLRKKVKVNIQIYIQWLARFLMDGWIDLMLMKM